MQCGVFMENTDLGVRDENLRGSGRITSSPEECLEICEATMSCNAAIRVNNGGCYLKAVDAATVARVPRPLMTSFLICDDGSPPEVQGLACTLETCACPPFVYPYCCGQKV